MVRSQRGVLHPMGGSAASERALPMWYRLVGGLNWCVGWGGPVQVLRDPPRRWSGPKVEPRTPLCDPHPANQRSESCVQDGVESRPWQEPGGCKLPTPGSVVPKARCPAEAPLCRPVSAPPTCPSSNLIRYLKLVLSLAKAETLLF